MTKLGVAVPRSTLTVILMLGLTSAVASAEDLSRYRQFQFGTAPSAVAKQTGASPSDVKTIHRRPALIQELEWRPQPLGPSSHTEPVRDVVFTFYDGELYQVVVHYDRYETEGLTTEDFVEALSATYGMAAKIPAPAKAAERSYGEEEEILARWQDPEYRFDLIRTTYGPSFRLVGVLKRLEAPSEAAILEAKRLDDKEAPERNAARMASEEQAARAKLEKARLVNKPKFRP